MATASTPQRRNELSRSVLRLRIGALWTALKRQPGSLWGIIVYFFFEYVRPQSIYPAISGLPWAETALICTIILYFLEGAKGRRWITLDTLLLAFSAILLLSSVSAVYPSASVDGFKVYFNWVLIYLLLTVIANTRIKFLLFYLAFLLYSLKMSQHGTVTFVSRGFSFASWGATGAPGWFQNSGEFAIQMCIFLPLSYYLARGLKERVTRWKYWLLMVVPGTAVISIIASSSRGGQLGGATVVGFMILQSKKRVRGVIVALLVLGVGWQILPPQQKARFNSMGTDDTSETRLTYWRHGREMMNRYPMFGIGYNNWMPYYTSTYGPGELPHNIFIQAGSELGYTGLAAFFLMILGTFLTNYKTRRLVADLDDEWGPLIRSLALGLDAALVGFMASGFFVTVLYYPFFWVNLAMTSTLYFVAVRERRLWKRRRRRLAQSESEVPSQSQGPVAGPREAWSGAR